MARLQDLFDPIIPEDEFHPYFSRILRYGAESERQIIRDWANGFEDRDGKFVKEFQKTFNSGFWELYIHASLRNLGFQVDLRHSRPDFVVDGEGGRLALEAVVSLNPQGLSPDWAKHNPIAPLGLGADRDRLLDLATLRLAQSIQAKSDKWLKSYSRLPHCADRAFVICVAPFEQPQAQRQGTQGIARVLFGEPQDVVLNDEAGPIPVGHVSLQEAFKPSGSRVVLGLFRDAQLEHVSGVLFSSLATWSKVSALAKDDGRILKFAAVRMSKNGDLRQEISSKADYVENLLDGLHLFVNPFAKRALETKAWSAAGIGIHRLIGTELTPDSHLPDGVLVSRACAVVSSSASRVHQPGAPNARDFPAHEIARPSDGEWFAGPACIMTSDRAFLMLHHGWTICVGHDTVDDDWMYLVKRGTYLSMQAFVAAGDPGAKRAMIDVSIPSREDALERARAWIASSGVRTWRSSSKKRNRSTGGF